MGVFWIVLPSVLLAVVPDRDGGDVAGLVGWLVIGPAFVALGRMMARDAHRELRRIEDRVWLDDIDLWWSRHHDAEPTRVERSNVVEVGAGERTVVVRTVDGVEHTVTDLGTPAERVALATAIRETLAGQVPPGLPFRWARDGEQLWRRPFPGHRWMVLAVSVVSAPVLLSAIVFLILTPLFLLPLMGLLGLLPWNERAFRPVGTGWRVYPGRVEAVDVETRTGDRTSEGRRVVALGLDRRPRTGHVRLHALLDDEERVTIMAGWRQRRTITAFARWLADRADVPLHAVDEKHSASDRLRAGQPVTSAPPP